MPTLRLLTNAEITPESRTPEFSRALCTLLTDTLGISPERVYIEFTAPPRHLFGWNSETF
ncbi:hypothetical protein CKO25_18040 [Thiocapsa imhoffii]|uniref:Uncharacterized protein n=1 Tax=Thiocapsa imhoffii TaxID=382777 RepID=A0A9X0WL37_9GAMM|nr:phenylpyruvate tautomerase MIF-related protein [Thiocapsa imhoffii]MBK1646511.1 hypothetical protein [Thiocapsa imhoffii]